MMWTTGQIVCKISKHMVSVYSLNSFLSLFFHSYLEIIMRINGFETETDIRTTRQANQI